MKDIINRFIVAALLAILVPAADASPYVISDDRVRSMDITPVLGRGYSIMTNSYQSTCLQVEETTVPSYNYDCKCLTLSNSSLRRMNESVQSVQSVESIE